MRILVSIFTLILALTSALWVHAGDAQVSVDNPANSQALTNYMLNCQGCHAPDGSGVDGKVPSMLGQAGKFLHVEGGRDFLVQVPGSANSSLNDQDLAELLNWMLFRFSAAEIPDDFVPYSESEIQGLRETPLVKVEMTRAFLAEKVEAIGLGRP